MDLRIVEEPATEGTLAAHAETSIAFRVDAQLRVELVEGGLGGIRLTEEPVSPPWVKDYDANEAEGPTRWAKQWDLRNWSALTAFDGQTRAGGAVMAYNTEGLWFLQGRSDVAALWDIRVAPAYRRRGVGSALFSRAVDWARSRHCRQLRVETQQINVAACKFYVAQGCTLAMLDRFAYPALPAEVELVWSLDL
jgi:GNAT superfamily N-acetyltransferase